MTEESLFPLQHQAFKSLLQLVSERAQGEKSLVETQQAALDQVEKEIARARKTIGNARKKALDELEEQKAAETLNRTNRYSSEAAIVEQGFTEAKSKAEQQYRLAEAKLKNDYKERLWTIDSMQEAGEKEAESEKAELLRLAEDGDQHLESTWETTEAALAPFKLTRESIAFQAERLPAPLTVDPVGKLEKCLEDTDLASEKLVQCLLPRFVGLWGTVWCVFISGALAAAGAAVLGLSVAAILGVGVGGAVVGGLGLRQILWIFARKQVLDRGCALGVYLAETERAITRLKQHANQRFKDRLAERTRIYKEQHKAAVETFEPRIASVSRQGKEVIGKLENERSQKLVGAMAMQTKAERESRIHFSQQTKATTAHFDSELQAAEDIYTKKLAEIEATRLATWNRIHEAWHQGLNQLQSTCAELITAGDHCFPSWQHYLQSDVRLATTVPGGIRYGEYTVDVAALPDGTPFDVKLGPAELPHLKVPAFLPFPDKASILLKTRDEGRPAAVVTLQAMMLRFLTGLPAGKVRYTIIDPVGLGENFAAFMHLADYDEQLVTSRIWTEPGHIEKRLADLTEHMENVIQKYLRNQYRSIEEYNKAAGEVAEPYRVLVIANFPTNFSPEAARRLVSIMSSGPACGVCTLVSVDSAAAMPRDFRLQDLEQVAWNLYWNEGKFLPQDPAVKQFPVRIDAPPSSVDIANIVKRIGEASRTAKRVEVPFDFIAPTPDKVWTGSTRTGFEVPIGRAGATRRQMFILGKGTAQHALIAGKTGSGKSTLLHAMITNLALIYSPDEAELYLIDFKKGVEFKMYAAEGLPHARVVAIESEREFGISVLQRLDAILRERGDLYRTVGANDVATYRDAKPKERFPRILLVVDEFQEFFVEDDKLAQEASLLLDRLVRQGRAFGIHVLLGSQTLGGAYSIPRATIDQMAVRIALQCSDADAQLILSKDNTAARLLSRPGDAIYNDANGLMEGNDPFQVVWLSEEQREQRLAMLRERDGGKHPPALVFEGSLSIDLQKCQPLQTLLRNTRDRVAPTGQPTIWLGDAIAIKDPTTAVFRPQSGANLIMIGQHEEMAVGIHAAALTALAIRLQGHVTPRTFTILDGTPDDSDMADWLRRVSTSLNLSGAVIERGEYATTLAELATEVTRRQSGEIADRSPRFLFVQGLQRMRELRKAEDDYSFGRRGDKAASPAETFISVLKEGPAVGIHTILWCDSITNLNRAIDRQGLREFNLRVLFQMSATDSSQLIDTPAASRLGRNRALYLEEGLERPEKFRPYGLPGFDWLRGLTQELESTPAPTPA